MNYFVVRLKEKKKRKKERISKFCWVCMCEGINERTREIGQTNERTNEEK
jgi:hypothetical protein